MTRHVFALFAVCTALAACDDLGPVEALDVRVSAEPSVAGPGDTVELVGIAFNGSYLTFEAGRGCGPGIGFLVTDAEGEDVQTSRGPWSCIARDSNYLDPGETDVVTRSWHPPGPGLYRVRSYVWVAGLLIESPSMDVTVLE